jgi:addiction module HigA family antidote
MFRMWTTTRRTDEKKLPEIHPGEILKEEFIMPLGVTSARLAAELDVPTSRISKITIGKRPITVDTAMRLGVFSTWERASG